MTYEIIRVQYAVSTTGEQYVQGLLIADDHAGNTVAVSLEDAAGVLDVECLYMDWDNETKTVRSVEDEKGQALFSDASGEVVQDESGSDL